MKKKMLVCFIAVSFLALGCAHMDTKAQKGQVVAAAAQKEPAAVKMPETPAAAEKAKPRISIEIAPQYSIMSGDLEGGWGSHAKLIWTREIISAYLWGSFNKWELRIGGQNAGDDGDIYGAGFGMAAEITKHISLWAEVGYFKLSNSFEKNANNECSVIEWSRHFAVDQAYAEKLMAQYGYYFEYKLSDAPGGAAGLNIHGTIYKGLSCGLRVGYRFLEGGEYWKASNPQGEHIEMETRRNFSGPIFAFELAYTF